MEAGDHAPNEQYGLVPVLISIAAAWGACDLGSRGSIGGTIGPSQCICSHSLWRTVIFTTVYIGMSVGNAVSDV